MNETRERRKEWEGIGRERDGVERGSGPPSFACHHHPWSGLVRSFHSLPIL